MTAEKPPGLAATAATGDRLATLELLRNRLALQLEGCDSARDVATLAARLSEVMAEIADLAPPAAIKETTLDEIGARRRSRGAAAPVGSDTGSNGASRRR